MGLTLKSQTIRVDPWYLHFSNSNPMIHHLWFQIYTFLYDLNMFLYMYEKEYSLFPL